MVRRVSNSELQLASDKGKQISRPGMTVDIPELNQFLEHLHTMKHEGQIQHDKHHAAKMAAITKLIAVIEKSDSQSEVVKALAAIKKEHNSIAAEHNAMKEIAHVHKPCDYLLTAERDQRGLIDMTKGIYFKAVTDAE